MCFSHGEVMEELISVVMSTYNEPILWVTEAVNSILNQSYSNIEFIIIQDNPQKEELSKYLDNLKNIEPRVTIIKNKSNLGLVASLNRGLKYASGKYIARMDADDISDVNRLQLQKKFLEENHLDLVGSQIEFFSENGSLGIGDCCFSNFGIRKCLRYQGGIAHPTWFGKKEVFEELQGYHDIDACEDYDFLCRASLEEYTFGNVNKVLLSYRINYNGISQTKSKKQIFISKIIGEKYHNKSYIDEKEAAKYKESLSNENISALYLLKKRVFCKFIRIVDHFICSGRMKDVV